MERETAAWRSERGEVRAKLVITSYFAKFFFFFFFLSLLAGKRHKWKIVKSLQKDIWEASLDHMLVENFKSSCLCVGKKKKKEKKKKKKKVFWGVEKVEVKLYEA